MSLWSRRVDTAIQKFGDSFSVGGTQKVGIFAPISPSAARTFMSDSEIATFGRPIRLVYVGADDNLATGAVVSWSGNTLTVRKVWETRMAGQTLVRVGILT